MKTLRLAGRAMAALAGIALLATCVYLLVKGKAESAMMPAIAAGVLGYILLRPGKRTAKITIGGVVLDIMSEDMDTTRFNSSVKAAGVVASSVSQEISERTKLAALKG